MDLKVMWSLLLSFPTNIFFVPFLFVFVIMVADFLFNFVEAIFPDLDLFGADVELDLDTEVEAGLALPQILKKVPLAVALCVSLFFATILSFYFTNWLSALTSGVILLVLKIILIPVIAYIALWISAWVLKPLAPILDRSKSFAKVSFIGLKGKVRTDKITANYGEIMVKHKSNEFLLNARSANTDETISYGDEVVIVEKDSVDDFYLVSKLNH